MTLTAQWASGAYNVVLDANGGTPGSTTSVNVAYDSAMPALTSPGQLPTREGYNFEGFFDNISGDNKYYNSDGTGAKN